MKRKKRLEKGIESVGKQIEIHKEKLKQAVEEGNEYLERYYKKEIPSLEEQKRIKKEQLEKS